MLLRLIFKAKSFAFLSLAVGVIFLTICGHNIPLPGTPIEQVNQFYAFLNFLAAFGGAGLLSAGACSFIVQKLIKTKHIVY